jgi:GMP synthase (glutamine-hydrolysing)
MAVPHLVLIRLGEPIPTTRARVGDYALWFQRALPGVTCGVVDLRDPGEELPRDADAYLVMGSPAGVYEEHPWLPRALAAARELLDLGRPTLGVCFGHQLFSAARGGEVRPNPAGVEVGTITVELGAAAADDPLLRGLPAAIRVNASHGDTVVRLPERDGPRVLGRSARDAHQVLRWGPRAWSVQFHPEMRARETRLAVDWRASSLLAEGADPAAAREGVEEAPHGQTILDNFLRLLR